MNQLKVQILHQIKNNKYLHLKQINWKKIRQKVFKNSKNNQELHKVMTIIIF